MSPLGATLHQAKLFTSRVPIYDRDVRQFTGKAWGEIEGLNCNVISAEKSSLRGATRIQFDERKIQLIGEPLAVDFVSSAAIVTDQVPDASLIESIQCLNELAELHVLKAPSVPVQTNP